MSFALSTFPLSIFVFGILRQQRWEGIGENTLSFDAKLHATRALPCFVCAKVPPHVVIRRGAETEPVGAASVADMAAHANRLVGVAGEILRILGGQAVCW